MRVYGTVPEVLSMARGEGGSGFIVRECLQAAIRGQRFQSPVVEEAVFSINFNSPSTRRRSNIEESSHDMASVIGVHSH